MLGQVVDSTVYSFSHSKLSNIVLCLFMNLLLTHNGSSSLHYVVVIVVPTDIAYHINLRISIKKTYLKFVENGKLRFCSTPSSFLSTVNF